MPAQLMHVASVGEDSTCNVHIDALLFLDEALSQLKMSTLV